MEAFVDGQVVQRYRVGPPLKLELTVGLQIRNLQFNWGIVSSIHRVLLYSK